MVSCVFTTAHDSLSPFTVHASVESTSQIHFMLTTTPPATTNTTTSSAATSVWSYQLSSDTTTEVGISSLHTLLAQQADRLTWREEAGSNYPSCRVACDASHTETTSCDVSRGHATGVTRALHLLHAARHGRAFPAPHGSVGIYVINAEWHHDTHVSIDMGLLFTCGCLFLARVYLPVIQRATPAPALASAHLESVIQLALSHPRAGPTDASSRRPHLAMTVVSSEGGSSSRLCLLAALGGQQMWIIECHRTGYVSRPWKPALVAAVVLDLQHTHPFHPSGRYTMVRNIAWLRDSTDFSGQYPLASVLYQHEMGVDATGNSTEPPADHLGIAALSLRASVATPCAWHHASTTKVHDKDANVWPTQLSVSHGVLTNGPCALAHLSLSACSGFVLQAPRGHVGLFLRTPSASHVPSAALREAAAAEARLETGRTTRTDQSDKQAAWTPALTAALAQTRQTPMFCLLDTSRGGMTEHPIPCVVESAAALAVLGPSSPSQVQVSVVAALGWSTDKSLASASSSPSSRWTLSLLHVTQEVHDTPAGTPLHTSQSANVTIALAALPDATAAGSPEVLTRRVTGGWWDTQSQRGLLRVDQLLREETGALMWGNAQAYAVHVVAGRLQVTPADATLSLGGWPRPGGVFSLTDLLVQHDATHPLRELDIRGGSPNSDDGSGMEVILFTIATAMDAQKEEEEEAVLLLRNGLFLSVPPPPCPPRSDHRTPLRVLGRLAWPRPALPPGPNATRPVSSDLLTRQAAVEAVLCCEQDALVAGATRLSPLAEGGLAARALLMVCVVKGMALLVEPRTGQLRQVVCLPGAAAGLTASQLTMLAVKDAPAWPTAAEAIAKATTRAVILVSALRITTASVAQDETAASSPAEAVSSPAPTAAAAHTLHHSAEALQPVMVSLTLTERSHQPLSPFWPQGLSVEALTRVLGGGELEAQLREAQALASATYDPLFDLTLGDTLASMSDDNDAVRETCADWCPAPAFLPWHDGAPEANRLSLVWLQTASLSPFRLRACLGVGDSAAPTSGAVQPAAPASEQESTALVRLTVSTTTTPPPCVLGTAWPTTHTALYISVLPLPVPSEVCPGVTTPRDGFAVLVVHHDSHAPSAAGPSLRETAFLFCPWPGAGRSEKHVYTLYDAPLMPQALAQPPALLRMSTHSGARSASTARGEQTATRYLLGLATRDATTTPFCFDVAWTVVLSELARGEHTATTETDVPMHWAEPTPPPAPWLTLP